MTDRRLVVVLVVPAAGDWAPPGRDPESWRLALAEDTYEVLAGLDLVEVQVAVAGGDDAGVEQVAGLTWPGTPVFAVDPARPLLAAAEQVGTGRSVVLATHDAPDLPGLLVGKLFRALGSADVAVCPATDGSLVAAGLRLPVPGWITELTFDTTLADLDAVKPRRLAVAVGPGWHRLRGPADLAYLDPGLEGWDATRALLSRAGT